MNRIVKMLIAIMFLSTCAIQAQDANPIATNLKGSWMNMRDLLTKMADKMPDDAYRFKPTPDIQDFGQRMAHVIGFNMRACAQLKGEQKMLNFGTAPTKMDIDTAMKQANDECDSYFATATDADLMSTVTGGRGGPRTKLSIVEGNLLEHAQEVYGYMCVYLRLKGIVPPSSDRNER
jgi:hypothetical protein